MIVRTVPELGVHTSVAGGLDRGVWEGRRLSVPVVQIFLAAPTMWRNPPIGSDVVERFIDAQQRTGVRAAMVHGRYLTNLASPDRTTRRKSVDTFLHEFDATCRLGVPYFVMHPGSAKDTTRGQALARIAEVIRRGIDTTPDSPARVLLETTSGSGSTVGGCFAEMAELLQAIDRPGRTGVCVDTCHVFVAGYDLSDRAGYERAWEEFDREIGMDRLFAFHLNDTRSTCGSHLDRHCHIGGGAIGSRAFGRLVRDPRFARCPMVLETPKTTAPDGREYDRVNLEKLRRMIRRGGPLR